MRYLASYQPPPILASEESWEGWCVLRGRIVRACVAIMGGGGGWYSWQAAECVVAAVVATHSGSTTARLSHALVAVARWGGRPVGKGRAVLFPPASSYY